MKNIYNVVFITSLFLFSCTNSSFENNTASNNVQSKSINGTYLYSDNSVESSVTVYGSTWRSKLVIKSGFGSSYDNGQASYSSGIVKDDKLYDDSGYIELGSVNSESLSIPIGSSRIMHYK